MALFCWYHIFESISAYCILSNKKRTSLKINTTSVNCFNRVWERSVAYIFLFIPLPSVIPIEAGVFLSALLLFSGSNQRSKDKVAQLHLISILIPLCPSSLILLIPPYPLHHGRQVVELVKIRFSQLCLLCPFHSVFMPIKAEQEKMCPQYHKV